MSFKWGRTSLKRLEGVNDIPKECVTRALAISDFDMTIPWMGGHRTPEEQHGIFMRGASHKDGFKKLSYHQSGNAIDSYPVDFDWEKDLDDIVKGRKPIPKEFRHFANCMFFTHQQMIREGKVPPNMILQWGGFWKRFIDVPHWQWVII